MSLALTSVPLLDANDHILDPLLCSLVQEPSSHVTTMHAYAINGFKFHTTLERGVQHKIMGSVSIARLTTTLSMISMEFSKKFYN